MMDARGLVAALASVVLAGCAGVVPPPASIDPAPLRQVPAVQGPATTPRVESPDPVGPTSADPGLVRYRGPVEHIFFHPLMVYPFGAAATPGTAKFDTLVRAGFRIFCPIASTARLELGAGYAIQDRVHVDGISLLTQPETLRRFFDPKSVVDSIRPPL